MMARSTPTSILIVASLFCRAGGGWAKLVGTVVEVCNTVGAREAVRPMTEVFGVSAVVDSAVCASEPVRSVTEVFGVTAVVDSAVGAALLVRLEVRELVVSVAVEKEALTAADCSELSIAEKGYGSIEVVKVVSQQFTSPRPCPPAPAQHQLLSLDPQRLTSVKPSNWPLRHYSRPGSYRGLVD